MQQSYRPPAKTALPAAEFFERRFKVCLVKVGPHSVGKDELSIGGLPEKEIRKTLFTAGANQQIDVSAYRSQSLYQQGSERIVRRQPFVEAPGDRARRRTCDGITG